MSPTLRSIAPVLMLAATLFTSAPAEAAGHEPARQKPAANGKADGGKRHHKPKHGHKRQHNPKRGHHKNGKK